MVAVIKRFVELLEESISVRITVDSIWLTKYKIRRSFHCIIPAFHFGQVKRLKTSVYHE